MKAKQIKTIKIYTTNHKLKALLNKCVLKGFLNEDTENCE